MNALIKNFIYVLRKFRTSSILNILGLSAAFAVFAVTMIQGYYDLSYNSHFEKVDRIHLLSINRVVDGVSSANISIPMGAEMKDKLSEIEAYCMVQKNPYAKFDIVDSYGSKQTISAASTSVGLGFVDVFTPTILAGDPKAALSEEGKVIITEETAKTFFGNDNPMGKVFFDYTLTKPLTVVCVIADFPSNCSLANGIFRFLPDDVPENHSYQGYFLTIPNGINRLQERINSPDFLGEKTLNSFAENPTEKVERKFIPLSDVHLQYPVVGSGNLNTTLSLMAIGLITLIIAYINFLNFSIAMAPARMRTLNIQKILGASSFTLRLAIAAEAALFSLIAFALALAYIALMNGTSLVEMFTANLQLLSNVPMLSIIAVLALVLGLIFGIYPAYYITSVRPVDALKGSGGQAPRNSGLRNVLITIQFVAAIALITISLFIQKQNDYMQNYQWGIQKDNVVYVQKSGFGRKLIDADTRTFGEELKKDNRILDYTAAQFVPGRVHMGWGRDFEEKRVNIASWPVYDNFLSFFGVEMAEGNDFATTNNPNKVKVIFNRNFMDKYEFNSDVLGKEFPCFNKAGTVVGVSKDINFESLKENIRPMAFVTLGDEYYSYMFIRISGSDTRGAIKHIEETWGKFSKNTCEIQFLDESMDKLYKSETSLATLITLFSLVTIVISIMGVYGLITFNSKYRAKEIAIRKVNGARESEVMMLLNKSMLLQLGIAFVIAVPIAYYAVSRWLEGFAYRIPISWWIFLLAGLIVLVITVFTVSLQSYRAAIANPVKALKND